MAPALRRELSGLPRLRDCDPEIGPELGEARAEGCAADCTCSAACKLYTRRAEAKDRYKDRHMTLQLDLQAMDEDYREGAALEQLAEAAEQLAPDEANEAAAEAANEANEAAAEAANEAAADAAIRRGDLLALLAAGKPKADTPFAAFLEDLGLDDDMQIALNANFERRAKQQEERAADIGMTPPQALGLPEDSDLTEFRREMHTLNAKMDRNGPLTDDESARVLSIVSGNRTITADTLRSIDADTLRSIRAELAAEQLAADKLAADKLAADKLAITERNNQYRANLAASKSASKSAYKYACKYACKSADADEPKRRCSRQDARFENLPDFALNCGVCGYKGTQNQIQADAHLAGHLNDLYNK
ncbi:hypothetical protein T492DRAFT_861265 [Pavlovales sp. CCMP2436]|nr:hypothetical protein T492DRAFT_861265 [Pavlovales sp. CCMP2436]